MYVPKPMEILLKAEKSMKITEPMIKII